MKNKLFVIFCCFFMVFVQCGCAQLLSIPMMVLSLPFQIIKMAVSLIPVAVKYAPYALLFVSNDEYIQKTDYAFAKVNNSYIYKIGALSNGSSCYLIDLSQLPNNTKHSLFETLQNDFLQNGDNKIFFTAENFRKCNNGVYEAILKNMEANDMQVAWDNKFDLA